ncbi:MAG TPA: SDR family oxidoreductase [Bryobacteraceae bacterium]|jgi:NAD(P)-dependent dehydrogenase (short-subunit alcohol dehydrogenase family)|nr:SDR family oxidoreductase [Bryobacteraceae bacterium]
MSDLTGKRAVVTGASKGIGLEVARALLSHGTSVVVCGRDRNQLARALEDLRAGAGSAKVAGHAADVSAAAEVAELFRLADRELGGLDILVNNAGLGVFRPTAELTVEEWDRVIGANLSGAFYCSREALQRFKKTGSGWVINISSLAGKNPFAGGAAYNASKFGMNGFTEAMMLDHRHDNVRVSYVMPGSVDTAFGGGEVSGGKPDWKIAPEDIAEIVINILRMPARTLISRVEVRPSRPRKN